MAALDTRLEAFFPGSSERVVGETGDAILEQGLGLQARLQGRHIRRATRVVRSLEESRMAKKRQTFDRAAAKRKAARLARAAGKLQRREDGKAKARVEGKPKPKPKPKVDEAPKAKVDEAPKAKKGARKAKA